MASTKLPKELYVVWKGDRNNPAQPALGFLNAYDPGKTSFEKKRATQEAWAYSSYKLNAHLVMQSGMYVLEYDEILSTDYRKQYNDPTRHTIRKVQEGITHQPDIWKNEALTGFRIMNSVSRYSTSNKVWRILDPRGLEFEIPTAKLDEIIQSHGIKKGGEIDAKCAWMSNKNLVIVE